MVSKTAFKFVAMIVLLVGPWSPGTVFAQGNLPAFFDDAQDIATQNELSTKEPSTFITEGLATFLGFVGLIALAVIIWGGFLYITAAGDEQKAAKAKQLLIYAVIGLVLIMLAAVVVNLVISTFQ